MKKEEQEVLKLLNNLPISAEDVERHFNAWKARQKTNTGEDLHDEDKDNEECASQIFQEPTSNEPY